MGLYSPIRVNDFVQPSALTLNRHGHHHIYVCWLIMATNVRHVESGTTKHKLQCFAPYGRPCSKPILYYLQLLRLV